MSETKQPAGRELYEQDEHDWIAARETGLPASRFAATSPWTVTEALAYDPPDPAAPH